MILLHFQTFGTNSKIESETIKDAARLAIQFKEQNSAYPVKIEQDDVLIWENPFNNPLPVSDNSFNHWLKGQELIEKLAEINVEV